MEEDGAVLTDILSIMMSVTILGRSAPHSVVAAPLLVFTEAGITTLLCRDQHLTPVL